MLGYLDVARKEGDSSKQREGKMNIEIVATTVGTLVLLVAAVGVTWQYVFGNPHGCRNAVFVVAGIFVFARVAQTQHDTHVIQRTIAYISEMVSSDDVRVANAQPQQHKPIARHSNDAIGNLLEHTKPQRAVKSGGVEW